jgi:hypothetical protein
LLLIDLDLVLKNFLLQRLIHSLKLLCSFVALGFRRSFGLKRIDFQSHVVRIVLNSRDISHIFKVWFTLGNSFKISDRWSVIWFFVLIILNEGLKLDLAAITTCGIVSLDHKGCFCRIIWPIEWIMRISLVTLIMPNDLWYYKILGLWHLGHKSIYSFLVLPNFL